MDIKRITQTFTYRIEPKPEGGFIARASDPSLPQLEAATREELQQQIVAKIASAVQTEFPALKLPLGSKQLKLNLQIGPKFKTSWQTSSSAQLPTAPGAIQITDATPEDLPANTTDMNVGSLGSMISNTPITPEASSSWKFIRLFLILLAVAGVMYFFFLRH